jgi:hypothetical protein
MTNRKHPTPEEVYDFHVPQMKNPVGLIFYLQSDSPNKLELKSMTVDKISKTSLLSRFEAIMQTPGFVSWYGMNIEIQKAKEIAIHEWFNTWSNKTI